MDENKKPEEPKEEKEIDPAFLSCKYGMSDCLFRGLPKCKGCKDMSEYEWDYTDRY